MVLIYVFVNDGLVECITVARFVCVIGLVNMVAIGTLHNGPVMVGCASGRARMVQAGHQREHWPTLHEIGQSLHLAAHCGHKSQFVVEGEDDGTGHGSTLVSLQNQRFANERVFSGDKVEMHIQDVLFGGHQIAHEQGQVEAKIVIVRDGRALSVVDHEACIVHLPTVRLVAAHAVEYFGRYGRGRSILGEQGVSSDSVRLEASYQTVGLRLLPCVACMGGVLVVSLHKHPLFGCIALGKSYLEWSKESVPQCTQSCPVPWPW